MKQKQIQIIIGYSKTFTTLNEIEVPNEIKKGFDARFKSTTHDNKGNLKAISKGVEIIKNFDKFMDNIINRYKTYYKDFKYFNKNKLLSDFKKEYETVNKQITKIYDSILEDKTINLTAYFYAKKHSILTEIFLKKLEKININSIKITDLELKDENQDIFELGVFLGLEPILVTTMLSVSNRDDDNLNNIYGKLINKYSRIIAKLYPKEYIEATHLDKPLYPANTYSKFLKYLQVERNGQILL